MERRPLVILPVRIPQVVAGMKTLVLLVWNDDGNGVDVSSAEVLHYVPVGRDSWVPLAQRGGGMESRKIGKS